MKSLLVVVFVALAGQAMCQQGSVEEPGQEIGLEDLVRELQVLPKEHEYLFGKLTARVSSLLKATKQEDRTKPDVRLNNFSVDELLSLHQWSVEDCNPTELERRPIICKSIYPFGQAYVERFSADSEKKENVRFNLGQFCWTVSLYMKSWCKLTKELVDRWTGSVSFNSIKWLVGTIDRDVRTLINNKRLTLSEAVKDVLQNLNLRDTDRYRKFCSQLVEKFRDNQQLIPLGEWTRYYADCEVIDSQTS